MLMLLVCFLITGEIFIETREDHFDSKLVESGPPPLQLSNGDYLFFYNSATLGWPDEEGSAYHPGWVILDGTDPTGRSLLKW